MSTQEQFYFVIKTDLTTKHKMINWPARLERARRFALDEREKTKSKLFKRSKNLINIVFLISLGKETILEFMNKDSVDRHIYNRFTDFFESMPVRQAMNALSDSFYKKRLAHLKKRFAEIVEGHQNDWICDAIEKEMKKHDPTIPELGVFGPVSTTRLILEMGWTPSSNSSKYAKAFKIPRPILGLEDEKINKKMSYTSTFVKFLIHSCFENNSTILGPIISELR